MAWLSFTCSAICKSRAPAGKYSYEFVPLLERVLVPSERNWDQLLTILTVYFHGGYFLVCSAAEILQIQKVS